MFSGQGDYAEMMQLRVELRDALGDLRQCGIDYAEAERQYRVALRKEILMLRSAGQPVTICSDLARGRDEIADLRFNRDVQLTLLEAAKEAINVIKLEMRTINEQQNREWHSGGSDI